jgi:hypothetical protein
MNAERAGNALDVEHIADLVERELGRPAGVIE